MIVGHIGAGSSDSGIDTGDIEHSLRFSASRSTSLARTFGTATNRIKFTWSGWVKRGTLATSSTLFDAYYDGSNFAMLRFRNNMLECYVIDDGTDYSRESVAMFRDPSAFMHVVFVYDSANAVAADRIILYVNGTRLSTVDTYGTLPQNHPSLFNAIVAHNIGKLQDTGICLDGYLSRVCFVDGQALTPDSFGYLNTETNAWVTNNQSEIKAVVDAGGTNSFMLDFDDGTSLTTLGYDKSSKGNNWTLNNFSLTAGPNYDWMEDVPGNSFAVLNPLHTGRSTLTNGNLTASGTTDLPIILPTSGTWYFELAGVAQTWTPPTSFPSGSGSYNFGQQPWQGAGPAAGQKALCQRELDAAGTVTVSGTFTGNAVADGPFVWMNGSPDTLTINGNAVTFGTHADRLANGFKVRTNPASYNAAGSNTWTATISSDLQNLFKYNNAKDNS